MSIAQTCIYDTLESCKYAKYEYGKPVVSKCKDCNRNPNNHPKTQVGTKEELKPIDTSKYKITETGQVLKMTKDEMKNRISMALKDPVLQQAFEIICKENAELRDGANKWHDLRKDPNDLPKYNSTVLDENGNKIEYIRYGKWEVYSDYYERYIEIDPPIAWCEVPTFEE